MCEPRPNDVKELKVTIRATWASGTLQEGHKLITFMTKGDSTHYNTAHVSRPTFL